MKSLGLALVVLGAALVAAPTALAQQETSFTLESHTEGSGGYFTLAGESARNPTLNVPDGQTITLTLKGMDDGVHNVCVGSTCSEYVQAAGDEYTMTFTSSASTTQYFCQPHKSAGMAGAISVAGAGTPTPTGTNDTPGVQVAGVAIALLGAALLAGRRRA